MSIPAGLYVHVPFCAVKCPYCDFYSNPYRRERAEAYAARVAENIAAYPAELSVDTVYFGGGTPSILPPPLLGQMLHAARRRFSLAADTEITLEVNPLTATPAVLDAWRGLGVNRLSFGMQSAVDAELHRLGRRHTAAQGIAAVDRAAAAGFQNISCDLMLGTPGQT
uniref:radical SAM protein n=1 Tax=Ruminococcus champanellensis TaxID=1161942 RepID=UPI0039F5922A